MKIDAAFLQGLFQNVAAQQGRALLDKRKAEEAVEKSEATFQQALGGLAALSAVMERLNVPEPPAPEPETKSDNLA